MELSIEPPNPRRCPCGREADPGCGDFCRRCLNERLNEEWDRIKEAKWT